MIFFFIRKILCILFLNILLQLVTENKIVIILDIILDLYFIFGQNNPNNYVKKSVPFTFNKI